MPISQKIKNLITSSAITKKLDVSEEGLFDGDIKELVKLINNTNTKIDYINLYRNNIGDEGAVYLSTLKNVTRLNLGYNNIGDEGAISLFTSQIIDLDISDNSLSDKSIEFFLEKGTQLRLQVNNRKINIDLLKKLKQKLEENNINTPSTLITTSSGMFNSSPSSIPPSLPKKQVVIHLADEHLRLVEEQKSNEREIKLSLEDANRVMFEIIDQLAQSPHFNKEDFVNRIQDQLNAHQQKENISNS